MRTRKCIAFALFSCLLVYALVACGTEDDGGSERTDGDGVVDADGDDPPGGGDNQNLIHPRPGQWESTHSDVKLVLKKNGEIEGAIQGSLQSLEIYQTAVFHFEAKLNSENRFEATGKITCTRSCGTADRSSLVSGSFSSEMEGRLHSSLNAKLRMLNGICVNHSGDGDFILAWVSDDTGTVPSFCSPDEDGDATPDDDASTDGDTPTDGDEPVDGDDPYCDPQASVACYDGDVYWQDCHGDWAEKKEECEANGCLDGVCGSSSLSCTSGVCTDPATGFQWQEVPTGGAMSWDNAITHCENLNLDGMGWRLPNISELRSLVQNCQPIGTGGACAVKDDCASCGDAVACLAASCYTSSDCNPSSCTDDGGPTGCYWPEPLSGTCSWYWSSSPVDGDPYAWYMGFDVGRVRYVNMSIDHYVRCVR